MNEKRKEPRRRVLKAGKIVFNERQSVFDCVVRDLSASGARLELKAPTTLPENFELLIGEEATFRQCRVAWRSSTVVGVVFR